MLTIVAKNWYRLLPVPSSNLGGMRRHSRHTSDVIVYFGTFTVETSSLLRAYTIFHLSMYTFMLSNYHLSRSLLSLTIKLSSGHSFLLASSEELKSTSGNPSGNTLSCSFCTELVCGAFCLPSKSSHQKLLAWSSCWNITTLWFTNSAILDFVIGTNYVTRSPRCMETSPLKRKDKADTRVIIELNAVVDKADAVFPVVNTKTFWKPSLGG